MKPKWQSEDSIRLVSAPENEISRKIYGRYQSFFTKYVEEDSVRDYDENTFVNFLYRWIAKISIPRGFFLCIYSCVWSLILVETKIDIKNYSLLHKVIKQMTVKDLKKNADIFSADDMKIFWQKCTTKMI